MSSDSEDTDKSENEDQSKKRPGSLPNAHKSAVNQLATHLPDRVVFADITRSLPYQVTFQGVLMFLDISSFTSLTEKYSMSNKNGTDQLTKTLNTYMRNLVNEIIIYDGDILKFAGDAILTLWQVDSFLNMKVTVGHVIKCAMRIQEKCGAFMTSVGVVLKVKIGISAGEIMTIYLGNAEYCYNVALGRAIESVNAAEKFCNSGDVVVSPSAWVHCAGLSLDVEVQDDGKHRKVLGFEIHPDLVATEYVMQRTLTLDNRLASLLHLHHGLSKRGSSSMRVRKAVIETQTDARTARMRLYIAVPVLKKLDAGQPLEYLSEMRQVTIVFINLITIEGTKYENCQTLQSAFKIIYANIKEAQGVLNKVFMFDKGCTFLAIFGLPGFKHENDCARALLCAGNIKTDMVAVAKVKVTSIGVATGSSYCGVVGHEHRQEYTVIGNKVNMAARMMMAYQDKVTCDNDTYHHSKLHKSNFVQLEFRQMKGLQNIGTIREFKECKSQKGTVDALLQQEYELPLIGRQKETELFLHELDVIQNSAPSEQRQVIMLKGDAGIGKSRLLDSLIVKAVRQDFKVVFCNMQMADVKVPYRAVTSLLMELLELEYDSPHQERERELYETFHDPFIIENLPLLNDFLHLKLPQGDKYVDVDAEARNKMFKKLLFKIVHEMTVSLGHIIFAVDDAHFMDPESWEFVEELGHDMMSLVLISITSSSTYFRHEAAQKVLNNKSTLTIPVYGMHSDDLASLACQLLGCVAIPKQVERILQQKSHGVPSWCEQLLHAMLYDGLISVSPASPDTRGQQMVRPPEKYLIRKLKAQGPVAPQTSTLKAMRRSSVGNDIIPTGLNFTKDDDLMCLLASEITLGDVRIPDSIKGMIQARIDRMEELEQMLIKTSAIMGMSFTRRMLDTMLPKKVTQKMIQDGMSAIAESGIFCCASLACETAATASLTAGYVCGCPDISGNQEKTINDCQMLAFKSATLQETAYEMYTESLRRKIHMKAARYLESQAHKCKACGGGSFNPYTKAPTPPPLADSSVGSVTLPGTPNPMSKDRANLNKMHKYSLRVGSSLAALKSVNARGVRVQPSSARSSVASEAGCETVAKGRPLQNVPADSRRLSLDAAKDQVASTSGPESGATASTQTITSLTPAIDRILREKITESSKSNKEGFALGPGIDIRECRCMHILLSVYPQLVRHWKAAGNTEKAVYFLMESSVAAIAIDENMKALSYLKEIGRIFECLKDGKNPFEGEVSHVDSFLYDAWDEARMESLVGQALYHMGNLSEAIPHFHTTLAILRCSQPASKFNVFWGIVGEGFRQWQHHRFPPRFLGKASSLMAHRMIEQSRSLSHIFHDHLSHRRHYHALLTVLQQINKAEEVNSDLHELIIAYTCMMEFCQERQWQKLGGLYEMKAKVRCMTKKQMNAEDFMTMAHLEMASMNMRLAWGRISDAIESGYTFLRISKSLHDNDMLIQVLPVLVEGLLLSNRIKECVEALVQLEYINNETESLIGKAWYYGCCLDLILETGVQLEAFDKCVNFANRYIGDPTFQQEKMPMFFLVCALAQWCQRKGMYSDVEKWKIAAAEVEPVSQHRACMSVYSQLKLLEVELLELARCKKRGKHDRIVAIGTVIQNETTRFENLCKFVPLCAPRMAHYSAYFQAQYQMMGKAQKQLKKTQVLARKMGNEQERLWVLHNQQAWVASPAERRPQEDYWKSMTPCKENLSWRARCENPIKFTLPLPSFFE